MNSWETRTCQQGHRTKVGTHLDLVCHLFDDLQCVTYSLIGCIRVLGGGGGGEGVGCKMSWPGDWCGGNIPRWACPDKSQTALQDGCEVRGVRVWLTDSFPRH